MCHAITCISACTNARCDWLFNASSHGISLQHSTESRDAYGVDDPAMLAVSFAKTFLNSQHSTEFCERSEECMYPRVQCIYYTNERIL